MNNEKRVKVAGISPSTSTVTLSYSPLAPGWHNQLILARGTVTAGTATIKYNVAGKSFVLKDAYGTAVAINFASAPEPIKFDGLVDGVTVEYTGTNGSFEVILVGQSS